MLKLKNAKYPTSIKWCNIISGQELRESRSSDQNAGFTQLRPAKNHSVYLQGGPSGRGPPYVDIEPPCTEWLQKV